MDPQGMAMILLFALGIALQIFGFYGGGGEALIAGVVMAFAALLLTRA